MLLAWEDSQMLPRALGDVAAGACALLFLAAALGKLDSWEQWSRLTKEIPAPAVLGRAVRVIVPAVESMVVVLSFAWPAAGLASGTAVLAVFALAVWLLAPRLSGRRPAGTWPGRRTCPGCRWDRCWLPCWPGRSR